MTILINIAAFEKNRLSLECKSDLEIQDLNFSNSIDGTQLLELHVRAPQRSHDASE